MATNELVAGVINRIDAMKKEQKMALPAGYNAANALNMAWLQLTDTSNGQSLVQKTTPESQAKTLLNMVLQGLSPAKNQVYFIPYGRNLTLMRSYFGSLAILQRLDNVKDVWAEVVREGDRFEIGSERGRMVVKTYEPSVDNLDKPIAYAFAAIVDNNGVTNYTVMTKKQIDTSWSHAKTTKVQKEYPDQMALRTVLNRAAKWFINSSSDNDLLIQAINDTTADEYDNTDKKDVTPTNIDDLLNAPGQAEETKSRKDVKNDEPIPDPQPEQTSLDDEDLPAF
ncbi:recombinase RecT [Schleiferilactobacillus harbinensis]|uniref:Recombinase RecT n=1 Tax=Schleiferilactobacillus harbinensis TaxID=304207 RepID=A0A5P8M3G0_9LACO|nr:RecT family recombinase [Schleiferilactobacillus harbinensis]QFR22983.1 recombinase RecT [Schleiferilactobacillus harbinensis]